MKYLLIILFACSCAVDIDYKMQANRFDIPETVGNTLKGRVDFNYGGANKITLLDVVGDIVFHEFDTVSTDAYMESSTGPGIRADLGLLKRLDAFYRGSDDSAKYVGLKFQFLGEPEAAHAIGPKAAISFAYGAMDKSEGALSISKNDQSETREYDTNLELKSYDLSLNLGYRFSQNFIIYLNNFYANYDTTAKLTSNVHADTDVTGTAKNYGALLGLRGNSDAGGFHFGIEGGVSKGEWEDSLKKTIYPVGINIGFGW